MTVVSYTIWIEDCIEPVKRFSGCKKTLVIIYCYYILKKLQKRLIVYAWPLKLKSMAHFLCIFLLRIILWHSIQRYHDSQQPSWWTCYIDLVDDDVSLSTASSFICQLRFLVGWYSSPNSSHIFATFILWERHSYCCKLFGNMDPGGRCTKIYVGPTWDNPKWRHFLVIITVCISLWP